MLPVERIIGEEGLTSGAGGLRLAMRLPWYRSLPFSTVEVGGVTIDGEPVDLSDAQVEHDGKSWPLAEQGEQVDTFWFVRDSAFLLLPGRAAAPGSEHVVSLTINVSPPYIPGMTRSNVQVETLQVA
ncbi:DUF6379 domain-containing protein [Sphingobium sp. DEHP117]|uniref:C-glycoside deglycosidase beta subunit domain-containing protein n=1 Tax=Sphingobium sp. DEHP117 TaxID=2993436 RepID=UPI0027D64E55|nr:DUF6379 domain-containing protein [Sphingobium sp. DEHP117]MDQ4419279.1 DUF6379 domain-containing protein [Sphingobium sp. DEHP117]